MPAKSTKAAAKAKPSVLLLALLKKGRMLNIEIHKEVLRLQKSEAAHAKATA